MARAHGFQMRLIPMNNTHHATMEELVIAKELLMDGSVSGGCTSLKLSTRHRKPEQSASADALPRVVELDR